MLGKIDEIMWDDFVVLDYNNERKEGITLTEFTKKLYNPAGDEVSGVIDVDVIDLGNGNYRVEYIPDTKGIWTVEVYHAEYFPEGKIATHQIYVDDIDTNIPLIAQDIRDAMKLAPSTGDPEDNSIDEKLNSMNSRLDSMATLLTSIDGTLSAINLNLTELVAQYEDLTFIRKMEEGDWELVAPGTLYFYVKGTRTAPGIGDIVARWLCYNSADDLATENIVRCDRVI